MACSQPASEPVALSGILVLVQPALRQDETTGIAKRESTKSRRTCSILVKTRLFIDSRTILDWRDRNREVSHLLIDQHRCLVLHAMLELTQLSGIVTCTAKTNPSSPSF